jgi:hypothetical protein
MQSVADFDDKHAWDDSYLINSWDEALAEYNVSRVSSTTLHKLTGEQKYHSIAKSGKRLEDVLTEEELKELRE